jgi:hypothetical protein
MIFTGSGTVQSSFSLAVSNHIATITDLIIVGLDKKTEPEDK